MTRTVFAGTLPIGGGSRVSLQSMTNTDTRDVDATTEQILRLEAAGCELIRSSVYDAACAEAFSRIRPKIHIPIAADIHFDYRLAVLALENGADKIRFNPGNIGDIKRVALLADCAKAHHAAIRVGVNGGSLDKHMTTLYPNDRVEAMVQSALQHIRLLEDCGFYDIVVSLKASSVADTVKACRRMHSLCDYPLHLGVTETGTVDMGIVKSSIGIGALLLDGIGDTLRVSLSCDPVEEVKAGLSILRALNLRKDDVEIISCPTCGRTRVDLFSAVDYVSKNVRRNAGYLKIAVMGCAVNGPGEARGADLGIAFGDGNGVLFENGQIVCSGEAQAMLRRLTETANMRLGTIVDGSTNS
ncbi:MAG TPA: flavodoxin-dependent (E)-4-hydroxy-3-methylbut-2-enyl-diphosphate synthase [Clostridia bacterium]|nr:flavodoxin-dependent (E)-4-hydroxy-3-methylbut-2-enyl-diphosphate synthase [Clostridia bacterium]